MTPELERTGAPILLLRLVQNITKTHPKISFDLISKQGGPLLDEFQEVIHRNLGKFYWRNVSRIRRWKNRATYFLTRKLLPGTEPYLDGERVCDFFSQNAYQLIITNTLTMGPWLTEVRKFLDCPVITYVHELPLYLKFFLEYHELEQTIQQSSVFVVPCKEAADNLKLNYQVQEDKIYTISSSLNPYKPVKSGGLSEAKNGKLRIGTIGTPTWIKGADLFLQTVQSYFQQFPEADTEFIWLGGNADHIEFKKLEFDIRFGGLANRVKLISSVNNPHDYLADFAILFISSREECMPLVLLEAAYLKIPAIGFDETGGGATFIRQAGGEPVQFGNCLEMAIKLHEYLLNEPARNTLGLAMHQKLINEHGLDSFVESWTGLISDLAYRNQSQAVT